MLSATRGLADRPVSRPVSTRCQRPSRDTVSQSPPSSTGRARAQVGGQPRGQRQGRSHHDERRHRGL